MDKDEVNTKNLDQLIKALQGALPRARVGILGAKTVRNNREEAKGKSVNASKGKRPKVKWNFNTNAAIGAIHEFGGARMPMRSFLRVPIAEHLKKKMEASGAFDKEALNQVIKEGSLTPWVKKIAVLAEGIVMEAFESGGFGKWPPWKDPNYSNDDNRLLVDTRQLRESISSEVK